MSRENILFSVIGLLLGYVIAFHLVVYINQGQAGVAATGAGEQAAGGLPGDHPALPTNEVKDRQRLLSAAEAAARQAREEPKDFDAQARAAEAFLEAGDFEQSLDFLTRANALRPDDYDTLVKLGNANTAAERYETAEKWYKAALARKPDDPDVRSELALTYFLRKPRQTESAIAELRRGLELNPGHLATLHNLSLMFIETGKLDDAASTLDRLEKARPDYGQLPLLREQLRKARDGGDSDAAQPVSE